MELGLWTFVISITVLTLTPGVDTLLIVRNTTRGGWKDGAVSSLGICFGLFVHATVSAVGISLILLQTAWAFNALKLAGACYLVWLGIGSFRSAFQRGISLEPKSVAPFQAFNIYRSFREGLLSNVLNPKTVIFYMAFLPQFINPQASAMAQSLFLAALHFLIAMTWQCMLALIVIKAKDVMMQPKMGRFFEGVAGALFVGLGVKLALDAD
ncbi:LysE family translocator [Alkalimarinus alittae]|uniref:LysE family translocator n=1 Tax=Alkalimarinus alittae TaxID=2961619 RepID=A0ABY6N2M2_9ALTE|nr:LysE family translocator [Alkalimarinus alittae]UZE96331.1 LysE family translocator [Alkalimarinus alittae]